MAASQLIKITFYQHEIEAIRCMLCGVAEDLKVQSILGCCWGGANKPSPRNTKEYQAAKQVLSMRDNQQPQEFISRP